MTGEKHKIQKCEHQADVAEKQITEAYERSGKKLQE